MQHLDFITFLLQLPQQCKEFVSEDVLQFQLPRKHHDCPYCGGSHTSVDKYRTQILRGVPDVRITFIYKNRRYRCTECGRTFSEDRPFLKKYQRMPESVVEDMVSAHGDLLTDSYIARHHGISPCTVSRHFLRAMRMQDANTLDIPDTPQGMEDAAPSTFPTVLSMDEFRGNVGAKFQVAIHDLKERVCLDIIENRTTHLHEAISSIPEASRMQVETFSIDLSNQFRSIVAQYFPNATIAADKFHAMRLASDAMDTVRKNVQEKMKNQNEKLSFKKSRKLLLSRFQHLDEKAKTRLEKLLAVDAQLRTAYELKEEYHSLFDAANHNDFLEKVRVFSCHAEQSGIRSFRSVVRTTQEWKMEIWHGIATGYNNGFTEGCNNTIKVLKRIAYGFRNFENFRYRILYLLNNQERRQRRSKPKNQTSAKK